MGSFGPSSFGGALGGSGLPNYNVNPQPTGGQGPYGAVPGTIGVPPSPWQQATSAVPALGNTSQLTGNIMSELQGDINPQALKNMQDAAAAYGVSSGMPGSNAQPGTLAFNKNLRNIGLDTQAIQHQGAQDYNSLLGAISGLQTPQGLAAEIAAHNAQLRAAPDPAQAAQQQLANYWNALNAMRGPGGGTGGNPLNPGGGTGLGAGTGALGFGFGQFPSGIGTPSQTAGGTGQGFGGVPGQGGLAFNPETGEFQDTTPIGSTLGTSLGGASGYGAAPQGTIGGAGQSTYDPYAQFGGYYDQGSGLSPTDLSSLSNEDWMYLASGGDL